MSLVFYSGCGKPDTPPEKEKLSYADALQIYNQELMALDRLKAEREKLEQSLAPDAADLVGNLLERAGDYQAELERSLEDLDLPGGTAATEGTDAQQTLDGLADKLNESKQRQRVDRDEVTARIAELDEEIAEQQARVDRAKADRDAAEEERP